MVRRFLAAQGRYDEAVAEIRKAQQLDPLAVPVNRAVGWILYFARRYDESVEELRQDAGDEPRLPRRPTGALVGARRPGGAEEAIADIQKELEKPGLKTVKKLMLAYACAAAGRKEEANGILWELESKLAGDNRLALLSALLFTALDLKDRAFQELHRAFEAREPGLLFLKVAPWLDPLRTDPRYGALVEKLGLG